MAAGLAVHGGVPAEPGRAAGATPLLVVDAWHPAGAAISPLLFGLGVDLPAATYAPPGGCDPLAGVGSAVRLVRVGAATADDYDWHTDSYVTDRPGRPLPASFGCPASRDRAGATVLRVLDRARVLHAGAVVVLNGEVDDPQAAAGLVRLVVRRYGLPFAQRLYWEIGNAPATWQHFGIPLSDRRGDDATTCLPDQYAALVTSYAAALASALQLKPGESPRIVADEWIANATDQSWTGVVKAVDTPYFPFDSPDPQPASAAIVAESAAVAPVPASASLDQRLFSLRANLRQYGSATDLPLFVGAWNLDANSSPANPANALYGSDAQATFIASLLLHLARDGVAMAAWAPPLYTSAQAPFTQGGRAPAPGFRVFAALGRALAGARLISAGLSTGGGRLDGLAARRPDGHVVVALVNAASSGASLHLRFSGLVHSVSARVQTFAPGSAGTAARRTLAPADNLVHVPAFSATLISLS